VQMKFIVEIPVPSIPGPYFRNEGLFPLAHNKTCCLWCPGQVAAICPSHLALLTLGGVSCHSTSPGLSDENRGPTLLGDLHVTSRSLAGLDSNQARLAQESWPSTAGALQQ
jgi:hypothetical protein